MISPESESGAGFADRPLELIEHEICELSAHMAVNMCHWLQLVGEFDERRGWAEWGVYSCAHWLSWRCAVALRAGREQVRVARCLRNLPLITDEFAAGRLSYSKVRAMTRVATPDNEEYLVMLGIHATGAQLEKIVSAYRGVLNATTGGAQDAHSRRHVYWAHDVDGSLLIQARLPADEGAVLMAALAQADAIALAESDDRPECSAEHSAEDIWCSAEQQRKREPLAVRRADALVALARAQLASDQHEHAGPDPVELTVHVDVESLASEEIHERSELANGPAIAPETARRLGCDASLVRIIERDGSPLTVGRRTRSIPPALRRVLIDRDPQCRFPSCTHQRYLHAHHIEHWARGGPTNLSNLIHLCPQHHRLVHEGGYAVERGGGGAIRFVRPDGTPIPERPPPQQPGGPGLRERTGRLGVRPDDHTCMPLSAGDRIDYGMAIEGILQEDQRAQRPPPPSPPRSPPPPRSPSPPLGSAEAEGWPSAA
jgi:hypothetical protein